MSATFHAFLRLLEIFGLDFRKMIHSLRGIRGYLSDLRELKKQGASSSVKFAFGIIYPCLADRFSNSGSAKGHYFHQDLLVARRIHLHHPKKHIDVGSRIDGFVAHVAAFREIDVVDIRPLPNSIPNVNFRQADMMKPVGDAFSESCDSLSCLHALEHFGLGRYGDPVNYNGYITGLRNLHSMLESGGRLYLSVPIGPQRIEFNAHSVFSIKYMLKCLEGEYRIDRFSFVDDSGDLHENVPLLFKDVETNFGCVYGCGIFEMIKL